MRSVTMEACRSGVTDRQRVSKCERRSLREKVARMPRAHEPLILNWFRAKGRFITPWADSRSQNQPTDSAEKVFFGLCLALVYTASKVAGFRGERDANRAGGYFSGSCHAKELILTAPNFCRSHSLGC